MYLKHFCGLQHPMQTLGDHVRKGRSGSKLSVSDVFQNSLDDLEREIDGARRGVNAI